MGLVRSALATNHNNLLHRNLHVESLMKGNQMKKEPITNPNYDRVRLMKAIAQLREQERAIAKEAK